MSECIDSVGATRIGALPCYVVLELETLCLNCRHARKLERWGSGKAQCSRTWLIHRVEHVCDEWEFLGVREACGASENGT